MKTFFSAAVLVLCATIPLLAATADFNGDSKPDLIIRNGATGANAVWLMDGAQLSTIVDLQGLPNTDYDIVGSADFNADGKTDVVWRDTRITLGTGKNALWLMDGAAFQQVVDLPGLDVDWYIVGSGDFDGDQKPDLIWAHAVGDAMWLWLMDGTSYKSTVAPSGNIKTSFNFDNGNHLRAEVSADFDGNGTPDVVLTDFSTGQREIWRFAGTATFGDGIVLPTIADTNYHAVAAADFTGDGKPDIVFRNVVTGANAIWVMNGTQFDHVLDLPWLPAQFEIGGPR